MERRRLAAMVRPQQRLEFVTSRFLAKTLVGQLAGVDPAEVRFGYTCPDCGQPHGRPLVLGPQAATGLWVSLAHAGDRVVVAAADQPVGVDVEPLNATDFAGFDEVALTPQERVRLSGLPAAARARARAAAWVRKEALLKARGDGLRDDPRTVDPASALAQVHDLDVGPDYAAACAALTAGAAPARAAMRAGDP